MKKEIAGILIRYIVALLISLIAFFIPLFSFIFKPLTVWPTVFFLRAFYDVVFNNLTSIVVHGHNILFVEACIAGSAYFLLLILNLLTRGINLKKRIFIFVFGALLLLVMNILRLLVLIPLIVEEKIIFELIHKVFWYGISTGYVIIIWILSVFIFKIKNIPFISDIQFILKSIREKV